MGDHWTQGFIQGLDSKTAELLAASKKQAQDVVSAAEWALDEHSPSKKGEEIGANWDRGLINGMERESESVGNASKEVALAAIEGFDSEYKELSEKGQERIAQLRGVVQSAGSGLYSDGEYIGANIVDGMTDGIWSRAGAFFSAMRSVTNEAINAAAAEAQVHSPSTRTQELFEYIGEGGVVGLENKREKIKETSRSIVDEALSITVAPERGCLNEAMPDLDSRSYGDAAHSTISESFSTELRSIEERMDRLIAKSDVLVLDDGTLVARTAGRMNRELAVIRRREERNGA